MSNTESDQGRKVIRELEKARTALDGLRRDIQALTTALEEGLVRVANAASAQRWEP